MDPYTRLGLRPGATQDEIAAAFRKLAKRAHPDSGGDVETFRAIKEAYDALKAGRKDVRPAPATRGRRSRRAVTRCVTVDVATAMKGGTVHVGSASVTCTECEGDGYVRTSVPVPCQTCGGTGVSGYAESGFIRVQTGCPDCGGSGRSTRVRCASCLGNGVTPEIDLEVSFPPGIRPGDVFTVPDGAPFPDGRRRGDLELVIEVSDDRFRIVGDDVETDVEVEVWDAALGGAAAVVAPDGRRFRLAVPPGSAAGRKFRMKGMGLDGFAGPGDFVAVLKVRIPDASTGSAREAFSRLKEAFEATRPAR